MYVPEQSKLDVTAKHALPITMKAEHNLTLFGFLGLCKSPLGSENFFGSTLISYMYGPNV